jgi:hypothetical protein
MMKSRDLALVIMFAVLYIVFMILIGQVPELIAGIPGMGYAFTIIYSIIRTVALLMFEGRRWRFFSMGLLVSLIALASVQIWVPPTAMAAILNNFIVDVVFNSIYKSFKKRDRLLWWVILAEAYYFATHPLWLMFFSIPFYPIELTISTWFIPIMSVFLPVIILEAIAGGYIGYKIQRRVEKIKQTF